MARDHRAYPWAGNPRRFVAVAMPNGDAQFGVEGQLVFLTEQRGHCEDRPKFLSRAEAECLRDALDAALSTFAVAAELTADLERPRPYLGRWPIRGKTLAEVED